MPKLRAAVIGVGYLGNFHAQKYAVSDSAELVAVVDTDSARAEEIAAKYATRAITDYRAVLDESPDHADALHLLGVLASQTQRPKLALSLINRAIVLDNRNPVFFANLGLVFAGDGDPRSAQTAFKRALTLDPQQPEVLCNLGASLQESGDIAGAIEAFDKALALAPEQPRVLYNLATALKGQGQVDEPLQALSPRLTTTRPNTVPAALLVMTFSR